MTTTTKPKEGKLATIERLTVERDAALAKLATAEADRDLLADAMARVICKSGGGTA